MAANLKCDVLVLGAGMVGVCAALALQARGRDVVLVDRRGAAEETSHGNAGIIQREAVLPYAFPRDWKVVLDYALNRRTEANLHHWDLMGLAPWLWKHFQHSAPEGIVATANAARPLVERCIDEHEALMQPAGVTGVMRHTGYLRAYHSVQRLEADSKAADAAASRWGIVTETLSATRLRELEPHLGGSYTSIAGGVLKPQAVSVPDPGAVGKAYAALFRQRGGRLHTGDARKLESIAEGWRLANDEAVVRAREVVVAQEMLQTMGLRSFAPLVIACPGCGRTTSTFFQELADKIQIYLRAQMPVWRAQHPGVENMHVAVMGCVVNGPGESKHANIGISLPGSGENPVAPVYIDGVKAVTLKGDNIAGEFQALIDRYVREHYAAQS